MQWSKLKIRVKSLLCVELRSRIDFHLTAYRHCNNEYGRAWITVDGIEVCNCSHFKWFNSYLEAMSRTPLEQRDPGDVILLQTGDCVELADGRAASEIQAAEIHETSHFVHALRQYLETPISVALQSANPFVRALAVVDRRVGRRTLQKLVVTSGDHSLVRTFFELRCSAMGLKAVSPA